MAVRADQTPPWTAAKADTHAFRTDHLAQRYDSRSLRIDETIRGMADDAGEAQARAFLGELSGHVADISHKLEAAEERSRRAHLRGIRRRDPSASILRRELIEAQRLIDGLRRRFPDAAPAFS